jgi:hypothetical protein
MVEFLTQLLLAVRSLFIRNVAIVCSPHEWNNSSGLEGHRG